jgi:hypothetical protein
VHYLDDDDGDSPLLGDADLVLAANPLAHPALQPPPHSLHSTLHQNMV